MKKQWIILIIGCALLATAGCASEEDMDGAGGMGPAGHQTEQQQRLNEGGGPNHGIVQGKGERSYYQEQEQGQMQGRQGVQGRQNQGYRGGGFLDMFGGRNQDYEANREPGAFGVTTNRMPYGFVQHTANDPELIYEGFGSQTYIDRDLLAETVSMVVVGMPDVEQATVLVTDEDCIIGFEGNVDEEDLERNVELSGLSVTPRWYKVYASEDPHVTDTLHEIAQANSDTNFNQQHFEDEVDQLIERLGGPKESWEQPGTGGMGETPEDEVRTGTEQDPEDVREEQRDDN